MENNVWEIVIEKENIDIPPQAPPVEQTQPLQEVSLRDPLEKGEE